MDDILKELLADYLAEFPDPGEDQPFIDLDDQVPAPLQPPADQWAEILNNAKSEFEVDGATAVFSTWRVEGEVPLDIGDIEIGMHLRASRLALDAWMSDARGTQLLAALPEDEFILKIKFLREQLEGEWGVEDKFDPIRAEIKKGQGVIEISGRPSLVR